MNKSAKMIIVLTATAILSGGVLAYFNLFTSPIIEAYQSNELKNAVGIVLPGIISYDEKVINNTQFYLGRNKSADLTGVAFLAEGNGFQSKIKILVGMNPEFTKIKGLKILQQAETPGLGTKIENDPTNKSNKFWFLSQFKDLKIGTGITYVKNKKPSKEGEIQAITGATISSKSVVNILNDAINKSRKAFFNEHFGNCESENQKNIIENEIYKVLPEIVSCEEEIINDIRFYLGKNEKGDLVGVAFIAEGYGYQSEIRMLVGMNPELTKIFSLKILQQAETPEIGTKIECDSTNVSDRFWFTNQFKNLEVDSGITYILDKKPSKAGEIQAITGATISSESVVDILNSTIKTNREIFLSKVRSIRNR
ncbi:MAG: hypothetical protein DRP89_05090, partial [Candidatus Neomarinimicrobiota bacterium]